MDWKEFSAEAKVRLQSRGYAETTVKTYLLWTRKLSDHYAKNRPLDLKNSEINAFIDFLLTRRKLSPKTVSQASHALTAAYDAVAGRKLDLENKLKWKRPPEPEAFTPAELEQFLDLVTSTSHRTIFEVIYGCGLGLSQALNLKVKDVDFDNSLIRIGGKSVQQRSAILPNSVKDELIKMTSQRVGAEAVWAGGNDLGQLSPSTVQKSFKMTLRSSGIHKRLTIRSLKFSYIKHLQNHGVSLKDILDELGMSSHRLQSAASRVSSGGDSVTVSPLDLLPSRAHYLDSEQSSVLNWEGLHPQVVQAAKPRFEADHLADAVEASLKAVETRVREASRGTSADGLHGSKLMQRIFSPKDPILLLADLSTESGRNIQNGYLQIFSGAMTWIRNPKAHSNLEISFHEACHLLYVASLLMYKMDSAHISSLPAA